MGDPGEGISWSSLTQHLRAAWKCLTIPVESHTDAVQGALYHIALVMDEIEKLADARAGDVSDYTGILKRTMQMGDKHRGSPEATLHGTNAIVARELEDDQIAELGEAISVLSWYAQEERAEELFGNSDS